HSESQTSWGYTILVPGTSGTTGTVPTWPSPRATSHTTNPKHRNGIKKPWSQRYESLKGVNPTFPRNMHFAKKHKKTGLKKMQASSEKTMSAGADAIKALVKPKAVKIKMPKGPGCKPSCLAFIVHPRFGK
ncbi:60S ribosomal protein L29, partial [Lemmus lemmus]